MYGRRVVAGLMLPVWLRRFDFYIFLSVNYFIKNKSKKFTKPKFNLASSTS